MKLNRIYLQNYGNYERQDLLPDPELNIFTGNNAQGKSNLLDAIYYLSRGASGRFSRDRDIIRWGGDFFRITALLESAGLEQKVSITYGKGRKDIRVDGNTVENFASLAGVFRTVLFSPDDLFLVKGGPEYRRTFLDHELIQTGSGYERELQNYRRILNHRNALLKLLRENQGKMDLLEVYDRQLAVSGSRLIRIRLSMLEKLDPLARTIHSRLTNGEERLEVKYQCSACRQQDSVNPPSEEDFLDILAEARDDDIRRGSTGCGPHRDDLLLEVNGTDIRTFGSQGQCRTTALSLKMAELEYLKVETGEYPVLLLDDVLSELDLQRRTSLLDTVRQSIQTFITGTGTDLLGDTLLGKARVFTIKNGRIHTESS